MSATQAITPDVSPTNQKTKDIQQTVVHDNEQDVGFVEKYTTSPLETAFKSPRLTLLRILNLAMIVCTALMIWKGLICLTGSEYPVVVVSSGSMGPTLSKGDILILSIPTDPYQIGDIVVFKIPGRDIPVVYRILETHNVWEDVDPITGD
eukprot:UN04301